MKTISSSNRRSGFTLMETVIAIGVVSVLLTGFMIVFTPAAEGIKKSITIQEADRLLAALEQELVSARSGEEPSDAEAATGFEKALLRIQDSTGKITNNLDQASSDKMDDALLVYQYRGDPSKPRKPENGGDGSPTPVVSTKEKSAGREYTLVPMMRRKSSKHFLDDLKAIEGAVYLVKCVQLVNTPDAANPGQYALKPLPVGTKERGKIYDPAPDSPDTPIASPADYPDAVIAFAAEFYPCPNKSAGFFGGSAFTNFHKRCVKPVFVRNLAIRR